MSELGDTIKRARKKKGLPLRALAYLAGVSHGYISAIERGKVPYPPTPTIIKLIARALDLSEPMLLGLLKAEPKKSEFEKLTEDAGLTKEEGLKIYAQALKLFK